MNAFLDSSAASLDLLHKSMREAAAKPSKKIKLDGNVPKKAADLIKHLEPYVNGICQTLQPHEITYVEVETEDGPSARFPVFPAGTFDKIINTRTHFERAMVLLENPEIKGIFRFG